MERWYVAVLVFLVGCDPASGTLIVQVRSDLVPLNDFASVSVSITDSAGARTDRSREVGGERDWGAGVRVAEVAGMPLGETGLIVEARNRDGTLVVARPARLDLAQGTRVLTVLLTSDCSGVACPLSTDDAGDVACLAGRCVPAGCVEDDPTLCEPGECASAGDCPSPAAPCAAAECTASGSCFDRPDHTPCGADVCDPDVGCVAIEGGSDAGPGPDAATDAGSCLPCRLEPPRCGCSGGQACYATTLGDRSCEDQGSLPTGAICTRQQDCSPGAVCHMLFDDRVCLMACDMSTQCPPTELCFDLGPPLNTAVCLPNDCNPTDNSNCGTGLSCDLPFLTDVEGRSIEAQVCRRLGTFLVDDACVQRTQCGERLTCTAGLGTQSCRQFCTDDSDCTGGTVCLSLMGSTGQGTCSSRCDPLDPMSTCIGSSVCGLVTRQAKRGIMVRAPLCGEMGVASAGQACVSTHDCMPYHTCTSISGGEPRLCHELCQVGASGCGVGTCVRFPTLEPVGVPFEIGHCI